jgi:hypothetical protein
MMMFLRSTRVSVVASLAFLAAVSVAHAGSVQWSGWQGYGDTCLAEDGGCQLAQETIQYSADAVSPATGASVCNTSIPVGTTVNFNVGSHTPSDFSWFLTGYWDDSPYGNWSSQVPDLSANVAANASAVGSGAAPSPLPNDLSGANVGYAKPPVVTIAGLDSFFTCGAPDQNGSVQCTAAHPGSATATFNFAATYAGFMPSSFNVGYYSLLTGQTFNWQGSPAQFLADANTPYQMYVQYYNDHAQYLTNNWPQYYPTLDSAKAALGPLPTLAAYTAMAFNYDFQIPAQSISCPVTVTPSGDRPTPPVLQTNGQCTTGQNLTVGITSTDPQNKALYYKVYWLWDTDHTSFERVPGSGTVPSGQTQQATHQYASVGAHTIAAQAVNTDGNVSDLSQTATVTCTGGGGPQPPTATISSDHPQIYVGDTAHLTATFAAGQGDSLSGDNIDGAAGNPGSIVGGLGTTTNPDATKIFSFTPTVPGTYTFLARVLTPHFPWGTYAQTSVSVQTCPLGQARQNGVCMQNTCTDYFFCDGRDLVHQSYNDVAQQCTLSRTTCPGACSNGRCVDYTPQILTWKVTPTLVRKQTTVSVQWDAQNAYSCTVTGSNGDRWAGPVSATETSKPIMQQTVFSISCVGQDQATTATKPPITVNVVPEFQQL